MVTINTAPESLEAIWSIMDDASAIYFQKERCDRDRDPNPT
jgi:hypothetical protein